MTRCVYLAASLLTVMSGYLAGNAVATGNWDGFAAWAALAVDGVVLTLAVRSRSTSTSGRHFQKSLNSNNSQGDRTRGPDGYGQA